LFRYFRFIILAIQSTTMYKLRVFIQCPYTFCSNKRSRGEKLGRTWLIIRSTCLHVLYCHCIISARKTVTTGRKLDREMHKTVKTIPYACFSRQIRKAKTFPDKQSSTDSTRKEIITVNLQKVHPTVPEIQSNWESSRLTKVVVLEPVPALQMSCLDGPSDGMPNTARGVPTGHHQARVYPGDAQGVGTCEPPPMEFDGLAAFYTGLHT